MPELRVIVACPQTMPRVRSRALAVDALKTMRRFREAGTFDARRVRRIGTITHGEAGFPAPVPGVEFLEFAVDATPHAA